MIQDKDVFENIEKAMEVPPVPMPWHIARKIGIEVGILDEVEFNKYLVKCVSGAIETGFVEFVIVFLQII